MTTYYAQRPVEALLDAILKLLPKKLGSLYDRAFFKTGVVQSFSGSHVTVDGRSMPVLNGGTYESGDDVCIIETGDGKEFAYYPVDLNVKFSTMRGLRVCLWTRDRRSAMIYELTQRSGATEQKRSFYPTEDDKALVGSTNDKRYGAIPFGDAFVISCGVAVIDWVQQPKDAVVLQATVLDPEDKVTRLVTILIASASKGTVSKAFSGDYVLNEDQSVLMHAGIVQFFMGGIDQFVENLHESLGEQAQWTAKDIDPKYPPLDQIEEYLFSRALGPSDDFEHDIYWGDVLYPSFSYDRSTGKTTNIGKDKATGYEVIIWGASQKYYDIMEIFARLDVRNRDWVRLSDMWGVISWDYTRTPGSYFNIMNWNYGPDDFRNAFLVFTPAMFYYGASKLTIIIGANDKLNGPPQTILTLKVDKPDKDFLYKKIWNNGLSPIPMQVMPSADPLFAVGSLGSGDFVLDNRWWAPTYWAKVIFECSGDPAIKYDSRFDPYVIPNTDVYYPIKHVRIKEPSVFRRVKTSSYPVYFSVEEVVKP